MDNVKWAVYVLTDNIEQKHCLFAQTSLDAAVWFLDILYNIGYTNPRSVQVEQI